MTLYPACYYVRNINVRPSITLPAGWQGATSLDVAKKSDNRITYKPVSYETLVDSPMFAGRYFKEIPLSEDVDLNIVADRPSDLAATPEQIAAHKKLVEQALKLRSEEHTSELQSLMRISYGVCCLKNNMID